jgi:acetyl esterase/lipase
MTDMNYNHMYSRTALLTAVLMVLAGMFAGPANAQLMTSLKWEKDFSLKFNGVKDIAYKQSDSSMCRLDCYSPKEAGSPVPVIVWFHGGGWRKGTKDSSNGLIPKFLERGWGAVNVNYRMSDSALAPAAVIDARCALSWVEQHAAEHHFDTKKIIIGGTSAGGHLALMTGMLPAGNKFDQSCGMAIAQQPAAILDFYGIADVADLLQGANRKGYAVKWIGDQPGREKAAMEVSPLSYLRSDLPPVFLAHGDADTTVPYTHALRLKHGLDSLQVMNELYTVTGGYHGKWGKETDEKVFAKIIEFLSHLGIK